MSITADPAFTVYAISATAVAAQMVLLDAYAGVVRVLTKTAINEEDAVTVAKGAKLVDRDPPEVARVMRAHRNAIANGLPFLVLGFLYVLQGASFTWALALFGTYTVARFIHALAYASHKQPWRTMFFVVGQAALLGIAVQVVRGAVA